MGNDNNKYAGNSHKENIEQVCNDKKKKPLEAQSLYRHIMLGARITVVLWCCTDTCIVVVVLSLRCLKCLPGGSDLALVPPKRNIKHAIRTCVRMRKVTPDMGLC